MFMYSFHQSLRRFTADERGVATLELVIVFPLLMIVFIAAFESAMILTRQIVLERSLDMTVRVLRLSRGVLTDAQGVVNTMCANTNLLPNCEELLQVDLQLVDRVNYEMPSHEEICAGRGDDIIVQPNNEFDHDTGNNDFLLVRACLIVDPILSFSGFGLNLARDDSGGMHMMASTIFVNEPE